MKLISDTMRFEEYEIAPERAKVIPASGLVDAVIDSLYGETSTAWACMPWHKTHDRIALRPGEVSLYAGINGNGKSLLTSQVALGLQKQDERVLIASFEMRAVTTMQRLTRQAAATAQPSIQFIRDFHAWTDGRLWLFDHYGNCAPDRLLAMLRYAADELGIKHLFVDSLMKVVEGEDDYNGQKKLVGDLCALAQSWNVHVHLVHHARKGQAESDVLDKFAIKGSGAIVDQVDNVFLVQRNKRKEKAVAAGEIVVDTPDTFLTVAKQRNGEWEGANALWYVPGPQLFVESENARPPHLEIPERDREPGEEG